MKTAAPAPGQNQPSRFWWWLAVGASVAGVVAFAVVIAVAAAAEWLRPAEDAPDGDPPVSALFRSMDERRES